MADTKSGLFEQLDSPASMAATVTPSDDTDLADTTRALYVGEGGDLAVTMKSGDTVTFKNVVGGTVLAVRVVRVLVAGTTADHIVGMY